MYKCEREFALDVAAEACRLARRVQSEVVANADSLTKGDRSPVTMADLAIQAVVSRRLTDTFPSDHLLAEEDAGALKDSPEMAKKVLELSRKAFPSFDADALATACGLARRGPVADESDASHTLRTVLEAMHEGNPRNRLLTDRASGAGTT